MKAFYKKRLVLLKSSENFVLTSIFDNQRTTEEIAVSIEAELIKVQRERMI